MILPITLTIAAAAALLNIWLAVRIGRVRLGELPLGQWRYLREDERF